MRHTKYINKYNEILKSANNQVRIAVWDEGYGILLNTGILLSSDGERRKFCCRVSSTFVLPIIDLLYNLDDEHLRDKILKQYKSKKAAEFHKLRFENMSEEERECVRQNMINASKLSPKDKKQPMPWNYGLTKKSDSRLAALSEQRSGERNPMYGIYMSDEKKKEKSDLIKQRIRDGEWTPHVHNCRTHGESKYKERSFRSSWEAMYASIHHDDEYETVRIPYVFNGNTRTYIVDFVNHERKTLTEIKPSTHLSNERVIAKETAARVWCETNGYTYIILDESYFVKNIELFDFDNLEIPNMRVKLARIRREARSKNRN